MPICFKLIGGQGDFYGVKRNKTMDRGTLPNPGANQTTGKKELTKENELQVREHHQRGKGAMLLTANGKKTVTLLVLDFIVQNLVPEGDGKNR